MEEVLKIINTEQSTRNKLFSFIWLVLMAIIMTNHKLSCLGYEFVNKEIELNTIINFMLSKEFLIVSAYYLYYVFLFFWAIKFLFWFFFVVCSLDRFRLSHWETIYVLKRANIIKESMSGILYIKNRISLDVLKAFDDEIERGINSLFMRNISLFLNLLISTSIVYHATNCDLLISKLFGTVLCWSSIIISIVSFLIICIFATLSSIQHIIVSIRNNGFYDECF